MKDTTIYLGREIFIAALIFIIEKKWNQLKCPTIK